MSVSAALAFAKTHRPRFIQELQDFVRMPSVSAQPRHVKDINNCATWLAKHLTRIGLKRCQVIQTARHPIVYAEWLEAPQCPTVLIYGHYDVQPVDPIAEWDTPPFDPQLRGNWIYGRGASDDKGQLFTHVKALEAYLATHGRLPVNVKCIFEGEEEIGSPHLGTFLKRHRGALSADVAVLSDMPIPSPAQPAITHAVRGAISLEVCVRGQKSDLHSGLFGGAVHNPLQALCEIIANLHDRRGMVTIPGFHDRVRRWSPSERAYMREVGPSNATILRDAGALRSWGEAGFTLYERTTIRPALTINGLSGGYQGPGTKSIIPADAKAKINIRLAPDQDAEEIATLVRDHIARITPSTVQSGVRVQLGAQPAVVSKDLPAMNAATFAYSKGFGARPVFLRSGGTIPVVNLIQRVLHIPPILMGFALRADRLHGPNERFHLPNFYNGIATSIWFLSVAGHFRTSGRAEKILRNLNGDQRVERAYDYVVLRV